MHDVVLPYTKYQIVGKQDVWGLLVKPSKLFFGSMLQVVFCCPESGLFCCPRVRKRHKLVKGVVRPVRCFHRVHPRSTYASSCWLLQHSFVCGVYIRCPLPVRPSSHPASVHLNISKTSKTVQPARGVRSRRHAVHGNQHLQRQLYQGDLLHVCLGSGRVGEFAVYSSL